MNRTMKLAAASLPGLALGVMALVGCGQPAEPPAAPAPSSASSTTPAPSPTTTTPASSGDVAACKGYLRIEPQANKNLKDIAANSAPTSVISQYFDGLAKDLEANTVAATEPKLVQAFSGAASGAKSAKATTDAFKDGDLDLVPDLTVIYENTSKAAEICRIADPSGTYAAIVNLG